ncbi:hypothetical protein [Reyranella sp.]|uniref:hypothetical protein n=1 Tax=Reyranella sp. TaxID=1929291 RepID=UPI000BCDFA80|nr:hypothetical protein [Reyranella sp.]OYY40462.1 MAG: hypothetical protein B7Y57_17280 [Rhodospirillales bacterium 35-66-84]OYZ93079.1 MAG: hypothetical protein B7Y08_18530 [Rhodospirillales bacterium 24-66-33]OZB24207.1 MAG: hypothetical protein B7X63_16490 [Rhodospirillales bacterium 39-66-50]HQS18803.1 hypothetical protein [Reyranella sp.]HQT14888.1 hypothetical protein [Reyranella sp.]
MTFKDFANTDVGSAWIMSTDFDRACVDLFTRLERGEQITMQKAANMVRMPLPVFAETFLEYLRAEALYKRDLAEAAAAVKH